MCGLLGYWQEMPFWHTGKERGGNSLRHRALWNFPHPGSVLDVRRKNQSCDSSVACRKAQQSWSGQEVRFMPHLTPLSLAITSSVFMPTTS